MLIWTTHLSKRKLAAAAIAFVTFLTTAFCLSAYHSSEKNTDPLCLTNNSERVAYLRSFGWEIKEEPVETLQFILPKQLEEPYLSYNQLQLSQGFDLSPHCGKQLSRYTYTVTNYPKHPKGVQINLMVCEGIPVAGDIFCSGADGFQSPLLFPGK